MLTVERLKEAVIYDKITGIFTARIDRHKAKAGSVLGTKRPDGYIVFSLDTFVYKAHRLAWLYVYGPIPEGKVIDHINGKREDNRLCNLRLVDAEGNMQNRRRESKNSSGFRGVTWEKTAKKWRVSIGYKGKVYYGGLYETIEQAKAQRLHLEKIMHPLRRQE